MTLQKSVFRDSLKPAQINRVDITDDQNANVWLNEDQRSLAIGKMGQNISLAIPLEWIQYSFGEIEAQDADDSWMEIAMNLEEFE